jgi:glucose/arabinose dehydrogenase
VPNARDLALSPKGTVFVGSTRGNVYALVDTDKDNRADQTYLIASDLNEPSAVAFRDGALYVAEIHRILRFDNIDDHLAQPPQPVVVNDSLPRDHGHGRKFIRFGPDGMLYVPVGAPCNVCEMDDPRYGSLLRMRPDGSGLEVFASGIRNTEGFDWHPETKELWFTDNGRDMLGDDAPPDELNRAPQAGLHFGFPYCHGGDIPDPIFSQKRSCTEFTPPALRLGPHVASLGMRFYTGAQFPAEYHNQIFIAEHGSWNRTSPLGYRITLARVVEGQPVTYEIFAEGWLQNGRPWGRPVDVQVMADGALLVSDDSTGAIYRISYGK